MLVALWISSAKSIAECSGMWAEYATRPDSRRIRPGTATPTRSNGPNFSFRLEMNALSWGSVLSEDSTAAASAAVIDPDESRHTARNDAADASIPTIFFAGSTDSVIGETVETSAILDSGVGSVNGVLRFGISDFGLRIVDCECGLRLSSNPNSQIPNPKSQVPLPIKEGCRGFARRGGS